MDMRGCALPADDAAKIGVELEIKIVESVKTIAEAARNRPDDIDLIVERDVDRGRRGCLGLRNRRRRRREGEAKSAGIQSLEKILDMRGLRIKCVIAGRSRTPG